MTKEEEDKTAARDMKGKEEENGEGQVGEGVRKAEIGKLMIFQVDTNEFIRGARRWCPDHDESEETHTHISPHLPFFYQ